MPRPREFDTDKALDRAMRVFWRRGYEGASMPELTRAMGINRPSLYAAFGNKEQLFRKALDRYAAGPAGYVLEALEAPTARQVAEHLLRGVIDLNTHPRNPGCCMIVHGSLTRSRGGGPIRRAVNRHRTATEAAIRERFERAKAEGDLPTDSDPATLALFMKIMISGIAVHAANGANREELQRVAESLLRAWPR